MYCDLVDLLVFVGDSDEVCVVLILGVGKFFSVGNDLVDFLVVGEGIEGGVVFFICVVSCFEKLLVIGVQGYVVGVGIIMLLYVDLVVVVDDVKFLILFVDLGVVLEVGFVKLLLVWLGYQCVVCMLFVGELLLVLEVLQVGLVVKMVSFVELVVIVIEYVCILVVKLLCVICESKCLMCQVVQMDLYDLIDYDLVLFVELLQGDEVKVIFVVKVGKK